MATLIRRYYKRKDAATDKPVRVMIPAWYVQYKDATGRWRRVKAFKDKEASRQFGAKRERKVERQRAGLVDLHDDEQKKPLAEHVAAFAKFLANKGNTAKHVKGEKLRVERLLAGCGFRRIPDISASAVTAWLAKQRADRSMSIKTSNYYLRALKAFCRWLVRDGRAAENRVAHLAMMNSNTDVRVERRTLEPDEFARLINAAESGEPIADLSGPSRVLLYLTAANSGLRASELRSLTPASIAVGDRQGVITVEAAYSKRRRRDLQPIRADLAKMLQACAKDRPADQPLWPGDWHEDAAKMIRTDLAAARRQWIEAAESDDERAKRKESCFLRPSDAAGRVFDFHALRHQYISSLAAAGVHPKVAQVLARHSTITLTMDVYSHVGAADAAAALEELPALPLAMAGLPTAEPSATAQANVVAQAGGAASLTHPLTQTSAAVGRGVSSCVNDAADCAGENDVQKSLQERMFGADGHRRDTSGIIGELTAVCGPDATSNPQVTGSIPVGRA